MQGERYQINCYSHFISYCSYLPYPLYVSYASYLLVDICRVMPITKTQINLDLIEIIQLSLKIYNL